MGFGAWGLQGNCVLRVCESSIRGLGNWKDCEEERSISVRGARCVKCGPGRMEDSRS